MRLLVLWFVFLPENEALVFVTEENWKLPEGQKLEGKHLEYMECFYKLISFQASFSLTGKFWALGSSSTAQTISVSGTSCIHNPFITGPMETLLFLLHVISPCNIILASLISQFVLCHTLHQFGFQLAILFFLLPRGSWNTAALWSCFNVFPWFSIVLRSAFTHLCCPCLFPSFSSL